MVSEILRTILYIYACTMGDHWCTWHRVKMPQGTTQMACYMTAPADFDKWQTQPHRGVDGWTIRAWSFQSETHHLLSESEGS